MRHYSHPRSFNVFQQCEDTPFKKGVGVTGCDVDISDFKILQELGRGDGGAVLKAVWVRRNKSVVCFEINKYLRIGVERTSIQ